MVFDYENFFSSPQNVETDLGIDTNASHNKPAVTIRYNLILTNKFILISSDGKICLE